MCSYEITLKAYADSLVFQVGLTPNADYKVYFYKGDGNKVVEVTADGSGNLTVDCAGLGTGFLSPYAPIVIKITTSSGATVNFTCCDTTYTGVTATFDCNSDNITINCAGAETGTGSCELRIEWELLDSVTDYVFDGSDQDYNPANYDLTGRQIELAIDGLIKYLNKADYSWDSATATLTINNSFAAGTSAAIKAL